MSTPYLGQIEAFAFNFAPRGWALCAGQLVSIQQNTALFALLGTYYGGDGVRSFGLPDLRGRVAVSQGISPAGSTYVLGETTGTENVTVLTNNMPLHSHAMNIVNNGTTGGAAVPGGSVQLGSGFDTQPLPGTATPLYAAASGPQVTIGALGPTGGSQPHNNLMPYLTINYCIAVTGLFPPRG